MKIRIVEGGRLPKRMTDGAVAYDCFARVPELLDKKRIILPHRTEVIPLGFAVDLTDSLRDVFRTMLITGRSGLNKKGISCCMGIIDADYRGEVNAIITNNTDDMFTIYDGDRIAQALIIPVHIPELEIVEELEETKRGFGGFGSTGI